MTEFMTTQLQPNKLFVTEYHDHDEYEYYLMGGIGNPEDYIDLCHALRMAGPQDKFILRLNSGGGQVRTGNQILNAIKDCQAETIGYIEHDCGSMATFLFLACDSWGLSKYAEWFSHTISGGNYGKESETYEASLFLRKQTHKRIKEEYKNFLTEEEISSILCGTDIYLDADEIMERLEAFAQARHQQMAETCDDPDCQDCSDFPMSLPEMIKQSVREVMYETFGNETLEVEEEESLDIQAMIEEIKEKAPKQRKKKVDNGDC